MKSKQLKHIEINQNTQETLTFHDLDRLAAILVGDEAIIRYLERRGEKYLPSFINVDLDEETDISGNIRVINGFPDAVAALTRKFNSGALTIELLGSTYVRFSDPVVEKLCANTWGTGTKEGVTIEQCKAVTDIGTTFSGSKIHDFDELSQFTKVTTLPRTAFTNCYNLKSIDLSNITSITSTGNSGEETFANCVNLKQVSLQNIIGRLGLNSTSTNWNLGIFRGCTNLESVILSNNSVQIGTMCFINCKSLKTINLDYVTEIWTNAFQNCANLDLDLSNLRRLKRIDKAAFAGTKVTGILNLPELTSINGNNGNSFPGSFYQTDILGIDSLGTITSLPGYGWNDNGTFYNCKKLEYVNLPETLTNLGRSTFQGCSNLTTINFPESITSIDQDCFSGCSSLIFENIYLPNLISLNQTAFTNTKIKHVTSLGHITSVGTTFKGKTELLDIILPDEMTTLSDNAFEGCTGLTEFDLNNVTTIGRYTFRNCINLSQIDLSNIVSIGGSAFQYCTSLPTDIYAPNLQVLGVNDVTTIDRASVFYGTNIQTISNLGNLKYIANGDLYSGYEGRFGVFANCTSLISVTLPESLLGIGGHCFYNDSKLENINIPDSVYYIGARAFKNCTKLNLDITNKLKGVTFVGRQAFYNSNIRGTLSIPILETLGVISTTTTDQSAIFAYSKIDYIADLGKITIIPRGDLNNTYDYRYGIFRSCTNLKAAIIPNLVTFVGDRVFQNCTSLHTVIMKPTTVPTLNNTNAFSNTPALENILVPEGTLADYQAASGWNSYSSIIKEYFNSPTITPTHVEGIDYWLRANKRELYKWDSDENYWKLEIDFFNDDIAFEDGAVASMVANNWNIQDGFNEENLNTITSIGTLFRSTNIHNFNELQYFSNLTSLTKQAFKNCTNLKSIKLPENLTFIDGYNDSTSESAFFGCNSLKTVEMPGIINIGGAAFCDCSNLKNILLNEQVKTIRQSAFKHCSQMTLDITNLNNLTDIYDGAFFNCQNLNGIFNMPNLNNLYGNNSNLGTFYNTKITKIESLGNITSIPNVYGNSTTSSRKGCFESCTELTYVKLSDKITSIGSCAFMNCNKLETIICEAISAPSLHTTSLNGCTSLINIYVPAESVEAYKSASVWSNFASKISAIPED